MLLIQHSIPNHLCGPTPNFQNFDVDCEEVALELQMELTDLQYLEDLKPKFLASYGLNFYKNHVLPSGGFFFACLLFDGISTFMGYLMPNPSF